MLTFTKGTIPKLTRAEGQRNSTGVHDSFRARHVSHSLDLAPVPGSLTRYNIKNPAGDFAQKDSNVEVFRQVSLSRKRAEKQAAEEARQKAVEAGETVTQEVSLRCTHTVWRLS